MDTLKRELDLRLDFYFGLTKNAQKRFNSLGYCWQFLSDVPRQDIMRITKNKHLLGLYDALIESINTKVSNNVLEVKFKYSLSPDKPKTTSILYVDFKAKTLVSRIEVKNETK